MSRRTAAEYAAMLRAKYVVPYHRNKCWLWIAGQQTHGYGSVMHYREALAGNTRVTQLAHHAVWESHYGPVPEGHHLHHTCGEQLCVNPAHLQLVTPEEHREIHRWRNIVRERAAKRAGRTRRKAA